VAIPYPSGSYPATESARDVSPGADGTAHVFVGTFDPHLGTYDSGTGTWTHRTHSGWSTANNGSWGGVAAYQNYVFVSDQRTFGDGGADEANGLVRFDLTSGSSVRFADGTDYIDVTMGWNGLLYALTPGGSPEGTRLSVYDPVSLSLIRTIDHGVSLRGVAVNPAGEIFGISWGASIYHFDANGALRESVPIAVSNAHDIDRDATGRLVFGGRFGNVTLTDESLDTFTGFSVGTSDTFVSFVTPVPEPRSYILALAAAVGLLVASRRKARGNKG
jgi:hypothetical protein